jgi:hypothetical protein
VSENGRNGHGVEVTDPDLVVIDLDGPHELFIGEEPCGCIRLHCTWGHTPQEILDGLDQGLTLDDLFCDEHRQRGRP